MPFGIGPPELVFFVVVVVLIFGSKRLPGLGNSVGRAIRNFGRELSGANDGAPKNGDP